VSAPASVRAGKLLLPSLPVLLLQAAAPPVARTVSPVKPTSRTNLDKDETLRSRHRTSSWRDRYSHGGKGEFTALPMILELEIHCIVNPKCRIGFTP
jgi:hypothetical protein